MMFPVKIFFLPDASKARSNPIDMALSILRAFFIEAHKGGETGHHYSVEYDQKKKMVFIDGGESGPYSCEVRTTQGD